MSDFDDPFKKLREQLSYFTPKTGFAGVQFEALKRATNFGALTGVSEQLRQMTESRGLYASQLDAMQLAMKSLTVSAPLGSIQNFIESQGLLPNYFKQLNDVSASYSKFSAPSIMRSISELQHPHLTGQSDAIKQAMKAAGFPRIGEALHQSLLQSGIYPKHLDALRSSALLTDLSAMQNALRMATKELPKWLEPAALSDTLLSSWKVTAGIGLSGLSQQSLIHDVLNTLHQARPNTFAFDVVTSLAETFDQEEDSGIEQTADLLEKYTAALIELYVTTKDWLVKQSISNMLVIIMAMASLYYAQESYVESHLSRLNADEQTTLARAAASSDPTPGQQEIVRHVQTLEDAIRDQTTEHKAERNIRVVVASAPLRLEPSSRAPVIKVVYPDDRVRVQEIKEGWALVEVIDYKTETTVKGWLSRKVLRVPGGG